MEKRESKISSVPLALVIFIFGLAIFIDGFVWFFVYSPLSTQINDLRRLVIVTTITPTPSSVPTATPSATVAPQKTFFVPSAKVSPTSVK